MDQITFSEAEYQTEKRKTRREIFGLSGTDGPAASVEAAGEKGGLILSQGSDWPATVFVADHAASPLHPAVLQSLRPRHRKTHCTKLNPRATSLA